MTHIPVLLHEVIAGLDIHPGESVLDGTLGGGGHFYAMADKLGEKGTLIGLDLDAKAFLRIDDVLEAHPQLTILTRQSNFRHLDKALADLKIDGVDKILLDIGLSSFQFEESGRGFSFQKDEPLLMTFSENPDAGATTALSIVNTWDEQALADGIFQYGEERHARKIARGIVDARKNHPIRTTTDLVNIILASTPTGYHHAGIHPATRTFQALRILTNDELGNLTEGIRVAFDALKSHGRLAIISFHSLEDRIVKTLFREYADKDLGTLITKKPIAPSDQEISENPRSRSAKLRIIQKN
ncbi:MAG: S-adenosyl-methyltransferase MraW, rRNA (cytosine1402-N4)-methyltransferase [Candidatus Parcubacteria bacterium]|jgi:16S rRNA (cytosine1402-N4)-methyltransferase